MVVAYVFSLLIAVAVAAWLWQQGYARSQYAYTLYGVAAVLAGLIAYTLLFGEPFWVGVTGHILILGLLLWGLFENRLWLLAVLGGVVLLAFVLPTETQNLLVWGLPLSLPFTSWLHIRNREVAVHFLPPPSRNATLSQPKSETKIGTLTTETIQRQSPVLECLDEGVVVSDWQGEIKFVNSSAADIIGLSIDEIVGLSVMDVLSRLPMLNALGPGGSRELMQFEMNGRLIQGRLDVIYTEEGNIEGSVAILRDITDAYQSQRAKEAFLTTVSHELRTPLTAIKGYVELFGSDIAGKLNDNQKLFLDTIRRNVERMAQLIDSMIFVSAVRGGRVQAKPSYADLRQIIQQIAREMEPTLKRNQQTMQITIDPQVTPIQADAIHISTVLQELVNNSIKYNEPGGKIQIDVLLEEGEVAQQNFVVVRVSDTGIGIDPADQLFIFDDFYRSDTDDVSVRAGGMGVGLAIVRALVEAYNGRIWFDSAAGQGSTFTFVLPTQQEDEPAAQPLTDVTF